MKKLIAWCKENIFGIITLVLLFFIPLYPKLPLINVRNTWVYVRLEDFVVLGSLTIALYFLFRKKITLRTPLTMPIFIYWIIGAIATIHGILLIFPTIANVFPNVAFFSFLRRIEYMSLFFVAFWSVKDKRFISAVSVVVVTTLVLTCLYGLGEKYLGFPAFLTMNEQFAKGIPIQISDLSRVPSTFGGQYDFAAYLVLMIPIVLSLAFGVRNWFTKAILYSVIGLGMFLMVTTVSRISFVALLLGIFFVSYIYHRRLVLFSLPIVALAGFLLLRYTPLLTRFTSTVRDVQVLVDVSTGDSIGQVQFVPSDYFKDKIVKQQYLLSIAGAKTTSSGSAILIVPYTHIPNGVPLLTQGLALTGENLPEGTGYVNLPLSPVTTKVNQFFYEPSQKDVTGPREVQIINGTFIIKKTPAYDLSFTTRFQGEWPSTFAAFEKNIFFGSGFGSVSLAVDNSYLRALGEVGIAGFIAYFSIFVLMAIYIFKIWPLIESRLVKSFIIGFAGGTIGLCINAAFIDVFEASKVAFVFWLLSGVSVSVATIYKKGRIDLVRAFIDTITSRVAIIVYLLVTTLVLYGKSLGDYFVGDDFTWLRWAQSPMTWQTIAGYFTNSAGFFFRPGAKLYYLLMYRLFWLNQTMYHAVSLFLHFLVATLIFFLAQKILKSKLLASGSAFLFLILVGYTEPIFWVSATGFLFTTVFTLSAILSFIRYQEGRNGWYFALTFLFLLLAPIFHELGIVAPLILLAYMLTLGKKRTSDYWVLSVIPVYLLVRLTSHSHWFSGDYNYNLLKLPLNGVGNTLGYILMILIGPTASPVTTALRNMLRTHIAVGAVLALMVLTALIWLGRRAWKTLGDNDRRTIAFFTLFFFVSLLPFLGLGNVASRYAYMAAVGLVILTVFLLQKLYTFFLVNGVEIAKSLIVTLCLIIALFQITQLTGLLDNWNEAGNKVQRFIISIDAAFDDYWTREPMQLHFVNVPITNGNAWVFPVGLPDALWFQFHNPKLAVFEDSSQEQAFSEVAYGSSTQRVFVFDDLGGVSEVKKPRSAK